ncbi:hypothetical protein GFL21_21140 [Rhizobium anhuiense]|nr:hypothetical protein [Rhizobium anhuiense]
MSQLNNHAFVTIFAPRGNLEVSGQHGPRAGSLNRAWGRAKKRQQTRTSFNWKDRQRGGLRWTIPI